MTEYYSWFCYKFKIYLEVANGLCALIGLPKGNDKIQGTEVLFYASLLSVCVSQLYVRGL